MTFRLDTARWDAVHDWGARQVRRWVCYHHMDIARTRILDVGAGWGKYREVLPEYRLVDAAEVWEPTVEGEDLRRRYRAVYQGDIADICRGWEARGGAGHWEVAILGDVLEHLTPTNAGLVLRVLGRQCEAILVVVPYRYAQGEEDGNPYQAHVQDDLTPELMASRYPDLRLVAVETKDWQPFKGFYVWEDA